MALASEKNTAITLPSSLVWFERLWEVNKFWCDPSVFRGRSITKDYALIISGDGTDRTTRYFMMLSFSWKGRLYDTKLWKVYRIYYAKPRVHDSKKFFEITTLRPLAYRDSSKKKQINYKGDQENTSESTFDYYRLLLLQGLMPKKLFVSLITNYSQFTLITNVFSFR